MPLGLEMLGRAVMRRARRGLYAGRDIKFGNKVSEDGGNKSRRSWRPNVHYKRLYSQILDDLIRIRVSTHAIRCIDKAGGLDEYLLNTPDEKLNSDVGVQWKRVIEKARDERHAERAQASSSPSPETVGGNSATVTETDTMTLDSGSTNTSEDGTSGNRQ